MAEEDIIFGKNRHFFGGIEPSKLNNFRVVYDEAAGGIKILHDALTDTVIDGQTICSVAGIVYYYRTDRYPKDEFDGTLIVDTSNTDGNVLIRSDVLNPKTTYYIAGFPYSTQGVYNRNKSNRATYNEPADMVTFSAKTNYDNVEGVLSIKLTVKLSNTTAGAMIRKSTKEYPQGIDEGELVAIVDSNKTYVDLKVENNTTYYYTAFPFTSDYNGNNTYNLSCSSKNLATATTGIYGWLYGFDLDTTDDNPDTRVTYPTDVENYGFTPAGLQNGTFSYGDWPSEAGVGFMPKPCVFNMRSTDAPKYLNPKNITQNLDGSSNTNVSKQDSYYQMAMEWPKIYTYREEVNGVYKFRCSDTKINKNWECWCNYDVNDKEIDHFYTAMFASLKDSYSTVGIDYFVSTYKLTSGFAVNMTASDERARSNGYTSAGWNAYVYPLSEHLLIQDLLIMMARTTDGQKAYGNGVVSGNTGDILTQPGRGRGLGNTFSGSNENYNTDVVVFGMENWWGNRWRRVSGWIYDKGVQKVKITPGTKDGSTTTEFNDTGEGYIPLSESTISGQNSGYITKMKTFPWGRLPVELGYEDGSSSKYECDTVAYDNSSTMYPMVSGDYSSGASAGPFTVSLTTSASTLSDDIVSRMSFRKNA